MDPSKRFPTIVMAAGVVVLLIAIAVGERMGDRVFTRASASDGLDTTPVITPVPSATTEAYGPDWKDSQTLAAAPDPGFPDPRVPPKPLPTAPPPATPAPHPKWTPNPNIPIWDQTPPPSAGATATAAPQPPAASVSPTPEPAASTAVNEASPKP